MARTKRKAAEDTTATADPDAAHYDALAEQQPEADVSFNPQEFDSTYKQTADTIVQDVANATVPDAPANGFAAQLPPRTTATGYIANPSSKRRESHADAARKLPGKYGVAAGDLWVDMIDKGDNRAGIGIKVVLPEGRSLSAEEKAIIRQHVKGEDGEQTGFNWDRDNGMWRKMIVRPDEDPASIPSSRPVAIRLDAESRVRKLADALREHSADPVGYADRIRQEREQAANNDRIPD